MGGQASLLWILFFSSFGMGYFIYGKKQHQGMPLISGIGLMIFPYFVSNPYAIVPIGILLMALPYFIKF